MQRLVLDGTGYTSMGVLLLIHLYTANICQHQEKQRKFTPLPGNAAVAGALRNNLTHDLPRSHKQQLDSFKIHSRKVGAEGYNSVCHAPKKDENT